ncbi:SPOR domain-containing protein [Erythrobacter sp. KY5]|nr:SPOR domain-containing protein [Erythrobacter sp. KY5]
MAAALGAATASNAQDPTSRAVVQPLPSPEVQRLNRALMELARRPRDLRSLLEAGEASLEVGDYDAAAGFYGRAADLEPNDARVKLGLGRVYLRSGRPLEAIQLFNAANASGASARDLLPDQALAFDMVGDQEAAQAAYLRSLELAPQNSEVRRRLALSYAISGDADGFQTTLAPLLEERDPASFRARAFGLAILGEQERAEGIVNATMPRDLAGRINPYLSFMPRLTASQQAAAANLGIFPRAADIGREDPRIARFAAEGAVGSLLEPSGEPFGAPVATNSTPITQPVAQVVQADPPVPAARTEDVANAFADIGEGELPVDVGSGDAVDIAAIDVPREAPPAPAAPQHPRRIWVQLATGRDIDALKFDWRRFRRQAPELLGDFEPHTTPWGQANRLLAGPVADRAAARELVNALSAKGLDTFAYTSPEGTEIQGLD